MAFLRLFKPPRNQQFSYKPRYWDPKKEEAEERRLRIETLQNGGVDGMKERLRGGFRKGSGGEAAGRYRNERVRRSNYSLLIILVTLVVLSYVVYVLYFPELEQLLG
ncbi:hypothetical protein CLV84_2363 [Neolewinella xylanilytica]|uniref:Uncharacterized protein n=1 Tax=Neolewinella xylanilytica TaxID=1514080 RepID=A0A2S6I2R7_9BACT|nr:hypothetical protein [Neolewinella xylanilytica]PPK85465.1 hypothetical protein CLV84_2363 [Neolewinella xylanilytica]